MKLPLGIKSKDVLKIEAAGRVHYVRSSPGTYLRPKMDRHSTCMAARDERAERLGGQRSAARLAPGTGNRRSIRTLEPMERRLCTMSSHLRPAGVTAPSVARSFTATTSTCTTAAPAGALSTSQRLLGARSGVSSTALGLGGVCWEEDDAAWMDNVHASVGMGITYFDTAPACKSFSRTPQPPFNARGQGVSGVVISLCHNLISTVVSLRDCLYFRWKWPVRAQDGHGAAHP